MAALSAPRLAAERTPRRRRLPVAGAVAIWQGAMVALSGAVAVPASANPALRMLGVAEATADNRLGASGALSIDVSNGCWAFDNDAVDPVTLADLGNPCFASDDHTVSRTAGVVNGSATKPQAGVVFDVDDAGVWVRF